MNCPKCNQDNDKVLESRANREGTQIRRRRQCLNCGHRFTSYERIEEKPLMVLKKDGSRQPFDIAKVARGIRTCTEKLKIEQSDLDTILQNIEDSVYEIAGQKNVISSQEVGELTLKELYPISPVAYVRFASVYKAFDSLEQFIAEINRIAQEKSGKEL